MRQIEYTKVWEPFPGVNGLPSSQQLALDTRCDDTLLCGTRGGGKTEAQIMRFRRYVGVGFGSYWRGVIFDTEYKSLDDIVIKSNRLFRLFGDGAQFMKSKADYRWVWPTGEELLFRRMSDPEDYWDYHGHEYPFIGWNELTKWATPECFNAMLSCNRSGWKPTEQCPYPIPIEVVSTTNPFGPGHNWVKRKYIDRARYGEVVENTFTVTNLEGEKKKHTRRQIAIFSSYKENPHLDDTYELKLLQQTDPNKRIAWLTGSWDITAGGIIDDILDRNVHMIPRFKQIPKEWPIDRSFDWGSTHPFSVGWYAVANGEEVELSTGKIWCPRPRSLIRFKEWYGCTIDPANGQPNYGTNEGLRLGPRAIAKGILERETRMLDEGLIVRRPAPGPADWQIYNVADEETDSIAKRMSDAGVDWVPADKSKGSRVNGLDVMRDMLIAAKTGEGAGFYTTPDCPAFWATTAVLPRCSKNPDDANTDAEDHDWDQTRYRVLWLHKQFAKVLNVRFVA